MRKFFLILLLLWTMPSSASDKKPMSLSYSNLVRCFPELKDDRLLFKVDLNILKELVDKHFLTSQSQLQQRKIQFIDNSGVTSVLILRNNFSGDNKVSSILTLQRVDDKGVVTEQKLSETMRTNPKVEFINSFLIGTKVKSDEYFYHDTKLNGVTFVFKRNFNDVEDLTLNDSWGKRSLTCEKKVDLGTICSCTKK